MEEVKMQRELNGLKEEVIKVNRGIVMKGEAKAGLEGRIRVIRQVRSKKDAGVKKVNFSMKKDVEVTQKTDGAGGEGVDPILVFPEEIWDLILANVKEAKDVRSCDKVCKLFRKLLLPSRAVWRFDQIFPSLRNYLSSSEIFNCRPVCQAWCAGVDNLFESHPSLRPHNGTDPHIPPIPPSLNGDGPPTYKFKRGEEDLLIQFVERMQSFSGTEFLRNRNPFIGRAVIISTYRSEEEDQVGVIPPPPQELDAIAQERLFWQGVEDLLKSFGKHIWYATVNVSGFLQARKKIIYLLCPDIFNFAPNLRTLRIRGCLPLFSSDQKYFTNLLWSASPAKYLETLEVDEVFGYPERMHPMLEALVRKYHRQLRRLQIQWDAWKLILQFGLDWVNLTELSLVGIEAGGGALKPLVQAKMPLLSKLALKPGGTHPNRFEDFPSIIRIVEDLSSVTNLKVLRISGEFREEQVSQCPFAPENLTTLEVDHGSSSLHTSYAYLLRFPFLENLNLIWSSVEAYERAKTNRESDDDDGSMEAVELRCCLFGRKEMYNSNIWRVLPRLEVVTVQRAVYTRAGYERWRKWKGLE